MTQTIDAVVASYHRCRADDAFVDTFYEIFMAKSPDIAEMFADTNFKIQKLMLRESLMELLLFAQGIPGAAEEVEKLGRRHKELKVTPVMYAMWMDSLCAAVEQHDSECTPEISQQWRQAMQKGIDAMQAL